MANTFISVVFNHFTYYLHIISHLNVSLMLYLLLHKKYELINIKYVNNKNNILF